MRWAGYVLRMVELRNEYNILPGKLKGKNPLRRPRRRLKDNTEMAFREQNFRCCWIDSTGSGEKPVAVSCEHGVKPSSDKKMRRIPWLAKRLLASNKNSGPWNYLASYIAHYGTNDALDLVL